MQLESSIPAVKLVQDKISWYLDESFQLTCFVFLFAWFMLMGDQYEGDQALMPAASRALL